MATVRVTLEDASFRVEVNGKEYQISVNNDGIFVQSDRGVKIVEKSEIDHWIMLK